MAAFPTRIRYTVTSAPDIAKRNAERHDRAQRRKGFDLVSHEVSPSEDGQETHVLEHSRPMPPPTPEQQVMIDELERRFGKLL